MHKQLSSLRSSNSLKLILMRLATLVAGPREAFVRILAQACAELESCLSWINENEVKLEEKKLIKALGESEWATYFVGSSPLLELFERIAWRGEDGGLSSWIRGVEERHRSGEGSNILVIDTSDPKDEEVRNCEERSDEL